MTRRDLTAGQWVLAIAVTLTCVACDATVTSTPTDPPRTTSTTPSTSAVPTDPPATSPRSSPAAHPSTPASVPPSVPASVLTDAQQEFMLRLEAIKPEIASNDQEALSNGAKVCLAIAAGTPEPQLEKLTARTFLYYDQPLTQEQATQVLTIVRAQLCPP